MPKNQGSHSFSQGLIKDAPPPYSMQPSPPPYSVALLSLVLPPPYFVAPQLSYSQSKQRFFEINAELDTLLRAIDDCRNSL